jgi:hypothetical protein
MSQSQCSRLTNKDLKRQTMRSSLKFHLSDSEDDQSSLERIHTFNLKEEKEEGPSPEAKRKEKRKKA